MVHGEYSIPTADPNIGRGFLINLGVQSVETMGVIASVIVTEIVACKINNTYSVMAYMICFNCLKLSDGHRQGSFTNQNCLKLRTVFVQLQDLESFLDEVNDVMY